MAREFDQLESEVRRRAQRSEVNYPPDLQGMFPRSAPPPLGPYRAPADPAADTFRRRWGPLDPIGDELERQMERIRLRRKDTPVTPGTRERYGDPSKVISANDYIPPSLNAPRMQQSPTEQMGTGAGALPPPDYLSVIERLLQERNKAQGISPSRPRSDAELMRLAGDVVPLPINPNLDVGRLLEQQRVHGDRSIQRLGGKPSPTLDLLDVLRFPTGQPYPSRARGGPVSARRTYVVGEGGPETFVPRREAQATLPPGVSFTPTEEGEGPRTLPPGVSFEPTGAEPAPTAGALEPAPPTPMPTPAPMAGVSQWPGPGPAPASMAGVSQFSPNEAEQAREVAALRTARSAQPPEGRQPGAATRVIENFIPATYQSLEEGAKRATLEQTPEAILPMATMALPTSVAYKTGRGIAAAANPLREAQIETGVMSIPSVAEGGQIQQATGRALASAPVGGGKLRATAKQATEELKAAGEAAATRPTGTAVEQATAGGHVRGAIESASTAGPAQAALFGVEELPAKVKGLLRKSDEDIVGAIVRMAGDKAGADVGSLAQIRKLIPADKHPEVQSAIISRIGQKAGEFDPATFVRNYGSMSNQGKNLLFGTPGSGLRYHLDSIESISRRAPTWQQFEGGRRATLGGRLGAGAVITGMLGVGAGAHTAFGGGPIAGPLAVLASVVPVSVVGRVLARPAAAASMAQWSKAYEGLMRSGGAPGAISSFKIASDNLSNTLGIDFTWTDFFKQARTKDLGPAQDLLSQGLDYTGLGPGGRE